jgi:hemerythrin-like domain-containing protein
MTELEEVRTRHDELLESIQDLKAMLQPEILSIKPNAKTAFKLLCSLGDKIKDHLSAEGKVLYPHLLIHNDGRMKSLAWDFINGEKPIRQQFEAYYKRWLKDCDFNFSSDFLQETLELLEVLEARISREQTVLLPRLENSGLFDAETAH